MLHKVDVANVISGLRPLMKQATTHLAHHHSKEIAKLESGKGKNAEKRRRKAETLRLEMVFLPKVVLDEVSKYALMMDFSQREKLLGDVKLPLETKVMIKLSTSKPVVSFLENFRSTHPEWKEKLPGLIETLGIYTRNKKKVKKNIEKSERKMARKQLNAEKNTSVLSAKHRDGANEEDFTFKAPKKVDINQTSPIIRTNSKEVRSAKVAEDSEEGDSDGEDNEEGDSDGEDSEEGCSDGEESGEGGSDGEDSDEGGSDGEDSEEGGSDGEGSKEIGRRKNQDNTKPLQKKRETHVSSGSVFAEVRRFADLQMEANSERKLNTISSRLPSSDLVENVAVEEDNFFLTEGNSFLKTVSVNRADGEGLGKKVVWSKEGKNLAGNRRQRRAQFTGKELDQIKPKRKAVGNRFDKTNERKSSNYASGGNKNTRNCDESNSDETLHPSWAAKRNQRISLNSFQGKKIVFNDNQTAGVTIPSSTDETLHPSWAAKRSQKLSLDSFKGKKIRFDDD